MKIVLGLLLALDVGVVCRLVGLPLPAPLALTGAILVADESGQSAAMLTLRGVKHAVLRL